MRHFEAFAYAFMLNIYYFCKQIQQITIIISKQKME